MGAKAAAISQQRAGRKRRGVDRVLGMVAGACKGKTQKGAARLIGRPGLALELF
jgi:hypothetical protein